MVASFSFQFRTKVAQHCITSFLFDWNWKPFVPEEIVTATDHHRGGIDLDRRTNEAKKRRSGSSTSTECFFHYVARF